MDAEETPQLDAQMTFNAMIPRERKITMSWRRIMLRMQFAQETHTKTMGISGFSEA